MRLLVVDDQESVGVIVSEVARHCGWESYHITTPLNTFASLEKLSPDLLFVDQYMPEMTGLEIIARLRSEENEIPVILCSGNIHSLDAQEIARLNIFKVIGKPFLIRELRDTLAQVIVSAEVLVVPTS
jgi:two-component system, OmpR family, response regulator